MAVAIDTSPSGAQPIECLTIPVQGRVDLGQAVRGDVALGRFRFQVVGDAESLLVPSFGRKGNRDLRRVERTVPRQTCCNLPVMCVGVTDQEAGADLWRAIGKAVYKHNLRPARHDDDD